MRRDCKNYRSRISHLIYRTSELRESLYRDVDVLFSQPSCLAIMFVVNSAMLVWAV